MGILMVQVVLRRPLVAARPSCKAACTPAAAGGVRREGGWPLPGPLLGQCLGELQTGRALPQTCCILDVTAGHQLFSWSLVKPQVPAVGLCSSGTPEVGEMIQSAVVMTVALQQSEGSISGISEPPSASSQA